MLQNFEHFSLQGSYSQILVRIANREDPDRTASSSKQSDLGLHCLSRLYLKATSVQKFRTFTVLAVLI